MKSGRGIYSVPRWRLTRWLLDPGPGVSDDIRVLLVRGLFGTLVIFAGGVVNTILVAGAVALRQPAAPFLIWLGIEIAICVVRLVVLVMSRRAAVAGRSTPTDLYVLLGLAWSASVGYGVIVTMTYGDWVAATLACLSAAAMVGGICFRNFSAPRFAGAMILLSLGPSVPGALISGEPLLWVVAFQIPTYLVAMTVTAFKLNKMLIATMRAERENEHRAWHDALTGLRNRSGLEEAFRSRRQALRGRSGALALLFLDLDGFKAVNDTYGHAVGDKLLEAVASRLKSGVGPDDVVARIGGDEFVVLTHVPNQDAALELGGRLVGSVSTSHDIDVEITGRIGVSVGIAMTPEHGVTLRELLTASDAALYEAKSSGKSQCRMASTESNLAALRRLAASDGREPSAHRRAGGSL